MPGRKLSGRAHASACQQQQTVPVRLPWRQTPRQSKVAQQGVRGRARREPGPGAERPPGLMPEHAHGTGS